MSHDQAARGFEDESRSTGWLLIIGVAVFAALFSLVTHHTSSGTAPPPPGPSAFAAPTPSTSASASAGPSALASDTPSVQPSPADPTAAVLKQIGGYVSVRQVCPPRTDGRKTLDVRFLLANLTPLPEQLLSVTAELPMGGLHPVGSAVQGGTCAHPTGAPAKPAGNPMARNGSLVVTLTFTLPKACPAPYPVQAVVKVRIAGQTRLDTVALYTDLGTVKFDLCKGQTA